MPFPTTEENVEAAERDLRVRLPREYRERLISVNGGELSTGGGNWRVFPVLDLSRPAASRTNDIVTETRRARSLDGFPKDAVAIASNAAGDFLALVPASSSKGLDPQVQLWSRETHKCKAVALRYDDK
jgi:SMI1 / KNR4 family (SUKH-1)